MGIVSETSDLSWIDSAPEPDVPAAKLHVLQLAPIKDKMGDKWDKLSVLVHKLFEKSLRNVQGPSDHFLLVDELSYIVTFHNLSLEAASLACAAVAREVCELLFGDIDDIAVRGLVAMVPRSSLKDMAGGTIAELLERRGGEIIIRHNPENQVAGHEDFKVPCTPDEPARGEWITAAQALFARSGTGIALFPVWDIKSRKSATMSMSAHTADKTPCGVRALIKQAHDGYFVEHEIALLRAAAAYTWRVHQMHKVCGIGVGVSYETLTGFHARLAYVGALKTIPALSSCPLVIRIERVPEGTPHGRLAEIVAMLAFPNIRTTVEFQSLRDLADLDIRLGAAGIGWAFQPQTDIVAFRTGAVKLAQRAVLQKAFSFTHNLKNAELLGAAQESGIRFGSGAAFGAPALSIEDPVPDFPLHA